MNRAFLSLAVVLGTSSLLLVDSAIKGAAILVVATCVAMLLGRDSAATRHLVWLLAIVAMLVVPAFSAMLPQWRALPAWAMISTEPVAVETPSPVVEPPVPSQAELPPRASPFHDEAPVVARQPMTEVPVSLPEDVAAEVTLEPIEPRWDRAHVLPLLWAIGFSVVMLRLMAARWMLWRSERRGTVIALSRRPRDTSSTESSGDPVVTAFVAACQKLGLRQPVRLLIHSERTIPVAWGIIRLRLLLPAGAREWSVEQLQSVLLHELAHIKRRDTIAQLLAQIACGLHWFNPLVWFAAWRLHVERERACDDLVLASGVRASAYAEHLLNVVTRLSSSPWTQACGLAMARKSTLEGRLLAVLSEKLNRRRVPAALAAVALLVGASIVIPIAMLRAADEKWDPPQAAHIGANDFSTYCIHDGARAPLVIAYRGDFDSSSNNSANPKSRTWNNAATLTIKAKDGKKEVAFRRDHTAPDKLTLAGKDYDLTKGRVFLVSDDGESVRQLAMTPPVIATREAASDFARRIATKMTTADVSFKVVALEDVPVWSTATAGKWRLSDGVTMEVKQEVVHATDIASKAILTWPKDATGTTVRHVIWLAGDAFAAREPWLLAWERGASVLWTMTGRMQSSQDFRKVLPKPNFLRRIDFSDRSNITTTTWSYVPDAVPDAVRGAFLLAFEPLATTPRTPDQAQGSVQTSQAHDIRPVTELLSGTWKNQQGHIDVRLTFPVKVTNEVKWTIDHKQQKGVSVVNTSLSRRDSPDENAVHLIQHYISPKQGQTPLEARLGVLRRGIGDTLLLDIMPHVDFPEYDRATGIELVRDDAAQAKAERDRQPKHKEALSLFRQWQDSARTDGKIPGGALGSLARAATHFVTLNPTDERAPKLAELLKRIDMSRDWTQAEAVALLDDVTAIYANLPTWAEDASPFSTASPIRPGSPLPAGLTGAAWGQPADNGLRAAWLLEPRANAYPLGTNLKARVLFHNAGQQTVVFRTPAWHQEGTHTARDASGADIKVFSLYWTTIIPLVAIRLAPGEYAEVGGHGISVGARSEDDDSWNSSAGLRVGAWIEAKEGDEVTLLPTAVVATEDLWTMLKDRRTPVEMWKAIVRERIAREAPMPAAAADREQFIRHVMLDLLGAPPTQEEIAAFTADNAPNALAALGERIAPRVAPFAGNLPASEITFRVRAADPEAATKPRVASGPGRYPIGDQVRLVIVRRPDGERRVNEANITFFSPDPQAEPPGKPHGIKLPDGYDTWAIAWERGTTVLWVAEKGVLRSYDFSSPTGVKESRIDVDHRPNVPERVRAALRPVLEGGSHAGAQPAAAAPVK